MSRQYDFSGWATKHDIQCSDRRIITKDAFKHNDGITVPLVWNHKRNEMENIIGNAVLEHREDGVYAYGKFNNTMGGTNAKELVKEGDITSLSIYANRLQQQGDYVCHGEIREVSLVLAGANPEAHIDFVMEHSDGDEVQELFYYSNIDLEHSDGTEKVTSRQEVYDTMSDVQKDFLSAILTVLEHRNDDVEFGPSDGSDARTKSMLDSMTHDQLRLMYDLIEDEIGDDVEHSDNEDIEHSNDETIKDVVNSMSEKQKNVMYALIADATTNYKNSKGEQDMKHNLFENQNGNGVEMEHAQKLQDVLQDAKRYGSLKESALEHGIDNIEYLFPEAQTMSKTPDFIQRDMGWVGTVMSGVHNTPFSRVKSMHADITAEEARALGYMKGNLKKEEVFTLLKRTTNPQTIYKKQKLHRDDVIDITDFDVVAWLKSEMRMMLNEEIARAILVGDGRSGASEDKIQEDHIRPIYTDSELYAIRANVALSAGATEDDKAKGFIRAAIKNRKDYKGSGNPTMFMSEDMLTDCLLLEDGMGRIIYDSITKLQTALRVSNIVTVPVMEGMAKDGKDLLGIMVNLKDYNVGADKGGAVAMFDDFDIDYNAQKYLIETRCSGALTKPKSAIIIEATTAAAPTQSRNVKAGE